MAAAITSSRYGQRGVSLIEALIAVFILAIGLLSVAALQVTALRNTHSASLRSQATTLAGEAIDRMRVNRDAALAGDYDLGIGAAVPAGASIAQQDLGGWKNALAGRLPSGDGAIDCTTSAGLCLVTVQWDDSRATAGSAVAQVLLRARL